MNREKQNFILGANRIFKIWLNSSLLPVFKIYEHRFVHKKQKFRVTIALLLYLFNIYCLSCYLTSKMRVYKIAIYIYATYINIVAFLTIFILHNLQDRIVSSLTEFQDIQNSLLDHGFETKSKFVFDKVFRILFWFLFCISISLSIQVFYHLKKFDAYFSTFIAHVLDVQFQLLYSSWFRILNHFLEISNQKSGLNIDVSFQSDHLFKINNLCVRSCDLFSKITFLRICCFEFNFLLCLYRFLEISESGWSTHSFFLVFVSFASWCMFLVWNSTHNILLVDEIACKVSSIPFISSFSREIEMHPNINFLQE